MTPWLVEFPQARHAPEDVRRALRALDDTAELIYFAPRRWMTGKVKPNRALRQQAVKHLDAILTQLSTGARLSPRGRDKARLALLKLQGFIPIAEYAYHDADSRIVEDFRTSQWLVQHESEGDYWRQIDAELDAGSVETRKILGDEGLAREAYSRAFRLNFGRASQAPTVIPVASGRTRHVTLT